jgi:sugar lactone lactonase YvrE
MQPSESKSIIPDNGDTTKVENKLIKVAESSKLWTGVAVSDQNRIFVNYPRWTRGHSVSVIEITESGEKIPYPNDDWNTWNGSISPIERFVCVQSVYIEENNYLWILDTGNPQFSGVIDSSAKIIKINLDTDNIEDIIYVDNNILEEFSYMNDIRIYNKYAYITDSSVGAIIIINLETNQIIKRLENHQSTIAEDGFELYVEGYRVNMIVHSDGLAIDKNDGYLYYQALSSPYLYRIKTEYLNDFALSNTDISSKVEFVGEFGAADGMAFGHDGILYITSLENNSIRQYDPMTRDSSFLITNNKLKWPDSISITDDNYLYVTTSQLHLNRSERGLYKLFKLNLSDN